VTGPKLNERPVLRTSPGGRARPVEGGGNSSRSVARYVRISAYKVREVLDLIRGQDAERAQETLQFCERDAATVVAKVLKAAIAGAEHDQNVPAEELFVSACFADEGPTLKRWRPRARGRATRIRKRTCHVTVIVTRLPENELRKRRAARAPTAGDRGRRRRVEGSGRRSSPERERRVRASRKAEPPAPPAGAEPELPELPELAELAESPALAQSPALDAPAVDEPTAGEVAEAPEAEAPEAEAPTGETAEEDK